jgi:hypothetical protein
MSPLGLILVVVLILVLFGGIGGPYLGAPWPHGYGWGNGGIGVIGVILIILIVLLVMRLI